MSFKILNLTAVDLTSTKHGSMPVSVSLTPTIVLNISRLAFSSFTKGLNELCDWLAKYNCKDVCMESTGKYWIPVFNILEQHNLWVTLSHPKYKTNERKQDRPQGCEMDL